MCEIEENIKRAVRLSPYLTSEEMAGLLMQEGMSAENAYLIVMAGKVHYEFRENQWFRR
jgi:hypothetical protein